MVTLLLTFLWSMAGRLAIPEMLLLAVMPLPLSTLTLSDLRSSACNVCKAVATFLVQLLVET